MKLKVISITGVIVFLLCLAAFPVIDYTGGRACMRLSVPPLLPAETVPFAIGLLAVLILAVAVIVSLKSRRNRSWTLGASAIAITAMIAYACYDARLPGFLHGLRDRFATQVGYAKMRDFAREVSAGTPLTSADGILRRPGGSRAASEEQKRAWDDLVSRYPFLNWTRGAGCVLVRNNIVEMTWGSVLIGHWGFQVSPGGVVRDLRDREDRGTSLRVTDDIQFVYYYD